MSKTTKILLVSKTTISSIEECDFVTAIMTEEPDKNNYAYYELGYAQGIRKPIFLLINSKVHLPINVQGTLAVVTGSRNIRD